MQTQPTVISKPANWHSNRHGVKPVMIVAHGTAGVDSVAYLQRGGEYKDGSDRKVSIHCLISKSGTIYRMVPDERVANHAGFSRVTIGGKTYHPDGVNCNVASLGVELENNQSGNDPYPDAQLLAFGWLVLQWRNRWGNLPIVRHGDIDSKRRRDPVKLSVATLEQWVTQASVVFAPDVPSDNANQLIEQTWARWGNPPLDKAARTFAIPQVWFKQAERLGMCAGDAFYPSKDGGLVFQVFKNGFIYGPATGRLDQYRVIYF